MTRPKLPVEAVDAFAHRWIARLPDQAAVIAPVGVWPLLAILADVACAEVRAEIEPAIGLAPPESRAGSEEVNAGDGEEGAGGETEGGVSHTAAALALIRHLADTHGLSSAAGIWLARKIAQPISSLPPGTVEILSGDTKADAAAISAWVNRNLDDAMTINAELDRGTLGYLASAVLVRSVWQYRFRNVGGRLERRLGRRGVCACRPRRRLRASRPGERAGGRPGSMMSISC